MYTTKLAILNYLKQCITQKTDNMARDATDGNCELLKSTSAVRVHCNGDQLKDIIFKQTYTF